MNTDKLKQLARDLRKTPPHSPRDTLGGFVIAARMVDKSSGRPARHQWRVQLLSMWSRRLLLEVHRAWTAMKFKEFRCHRRD